MFHLLSFRQVKKLTGLSRSTVFRLEKHDQFPKRKQISKGRVAWLQGEIEDWINTRQEVKNHV